MVYDRDIREPLFDYLDETYGKNRIIEEKRMGRSRADVVMILPDCVCGIEIKSDADTYARLSRQVKDYSQYFDMNIIVVGSSHASHAHEHVPENWGIISVEQMPKGTFDFYVVRKPERNHDIDMIKKLSLLWRPELANIQLINGMAAYKQKSRLFVIEKIAEKLERPLLNEQISNELFERDYNTIAERINEYRLANGQKKRRNTKRKQRKYKAI